MRVACFTVGVMDTFPGHGRQCPGGNAFNQAVQFARAGWEAAFIGALGTDREGDQLESILRDNGIDVSHMARMDGATASNTIVNDETGERFSIEGTWKGGVYDRFRLSKEDWHFMAGCGGWVTHANCPDYEEALQRKPEGIFMAVDFLHLDDFNLMRRSMGVADVVFSGGSIEMEPSLSTLARETGSLVVLTLGGQGSVAFCGDEVWRQPALGLERVVDTTGCGDAFQAAFVVSFYKDHDVPAALLAGARAGREAAGRIGAIG